LKSEDFERISSYAGVAMRLLKKSNIPPTPQFYELLYTYAAGTNPDLNKRINAVLKNGDNLDEEQITSLCTEFLRSGDLNERLNHVSSEISARIESVHGAISHANASANTYSGLLQSASGDLAGGITKDDLASLTENLLSETRKMQETNSKLEERLDSAREHIVALQGELEQAQHETLIDPLTKIRNRKAFDRAMDSQIQESQASGETFALVMADIDHFKAFNDNHGHQTGDQVLRLVASTLDKQSFKTAIAARYGGEEFGLILPGTDLKSATEIADRLRKAVRSRELHKRSTQENLGKISVSFGVAIFREGDTVASLIERADACLYAAKENGRNQVVSETKMEELRGGKKNKNHAA
jgi:diguanylate cyclase